MKSPFQSKTIWGLIVMAVGAAFTAFNIPADPAFLADGIQASDIGPAILAVGYILKEIGHRLAKVPIGAPEPVAE